MYHQDWFMRQIEELVSMLCHMVFGTETVTTSQRAQLSAASQTESEILEKLLELIHLGAFCQAEDLLYEHLSPDQPDMFPVAVKFYHTLNQLTDTELEVRDFSREEILDGLKYVCSIYGFNPSLGFEAQ